MIEITNYKKYFLPVGLGVLGLVVMGYLSVVVLPKQLVTVTKASNNGKVSAADSILIGSKIDALADGEDVCKVNVFASDSEGRPVKSARVVLSGAELIEPKEAKTDNDGKAAFKIKSKTKGQNKLSASIDGVTLKSGLTVVFK